MRHARLTAGGLALALLSGCTSAEQRPVPFSEVVPVPGCGEILDLDERDGAIIGIAAPTSRDSSRSGCLFSVEADRSASVLTRVEGDGHALRLHSLRAQGDAVFVVGSYQHKDFGVTVELHRWQHGQLSQLLGRPLEWLSIHSGAPSIAFPGGEPAVALSRTESASCGTGLDRVPRTLVLNDDETRLQSTPVFKGRVAAATEIGDSLIIAGGRGAVPTGAYFGGGNKAVIVSRLNSVAALKWTRELYAPGAEEFFEALDAERQATPGRFEMSQAQRDRTEGYVGVAVDVRASEQAVFVLARFGAALELRALAAEDGSQRWRAVLGDGDQARLDLGATGSVGVSYVQDHQPHAVRVARVLYDEDGHKLRAGARQVELSGDFYSLDILTTKTGHVWLAGSREDAIERPPDALMPSAWVVDVGPIVGPQR